MHVHPAANTGTGRWSVTTHSEGRAITVEGSVIIDKLATTAAAETVRPQARGADRPNGTATVHTKNSGPRLRTIL